MAKLIMSRQRNGPSGNTQGLSTRLIWLNIFIALLALGLGLISPAPARSQTPSLIVPLVVSPASINFGDVQPNKDYTRSVTITNTGSDALPSILLRLNSTFFYYDRPDSGPDYAIPFLTAGESRTVSFTLALPDGAPIGDNQATLSIMAQGEVVKEVKLTFRLPVILNVSPTSITLQLQPGGSKAVDLALKNTSDTGSVINATFYLQSDPLRVSQRDMDLIKQSLTLRPDMIAIIPPRSPAQAMRLEMLWDKASQLSQGKYPLLLAIQYGGLATKDRIQVQLNLRLVPEDIDWDKRIDSLKPIEAIPGVSPDAARQDRTDLKRLSDLIPERPSSEYFDIIKPALDTSLSVWEKAESVHSTLQTTAESISRARQGLASLQDPMKRLSETTYKTSLLTLRVPMQNTYDFLTTAIQKLEEEISNTAALLEMGQKESNYASASTEMAAGTKDVQEAGKPMGPDFTLEKSQQLYQSALGHLDKAMELFNSLVGYRDSVAQLQKTRQTRQDAAIGLERRQKLDLPKAYSDLESYMKRGDEALADARKATTLNPSILKYQEAQDNFTRARDTAALIPEKKLAEDAESKRQTAETEWKGKVTEQNNAITEARVAQQAGDENLQRARAARLLSEALRFFQQARLSFEKARDWYARLPDEPSRQYSERNRGEAEQGEKDSQTKIASSREEADSLLKSGTSDLEKARAEKLIATSLEAARSAQKALERARDLYNLIPMEVLGKEAEDKRADSEKWAASKQAEVDRANEDFRLAMADGNAALTRAQATGPLPTRQEGYAMAKGQFDQAYRLASGLPDPARIAEAEAKRKEAATGEENMQAQIEGNRREADRLAASGQTSMAKGNRRFIAFLSQPHHQSAIRDLEAAIESYKKVGGREDGQKASELQDLIPAIQARMVREQRLQNIYLAALGLIVALFAYLAIRRYQEERYVAGEVEVEDLLFTPRGEEGRRE